MASNSSSYSVEADLKEEFILPEPVENSAVLARLEPCAQDPDKSSCDLVESEECSLAPNVQPHDSPHTSIDKDIHDNTLNVQRQTWGECSVTFATTSALTEQLAFDNQLTQKLSEKMANEPLASESTVSALEDKSHICEICDKQCSSLAELRSHRVLHATEESKQENAASQADDGANEANNEKYVCEICKKVLSSSPKLKRHYLIHTGEKLFQCGICDKKFPQRHAVKRHQMVHEGREGGEDCVCKQCGKEFPNPYKLKLHQRYIHVSVMKHQCKLCSRKFKQNSNLKRHYKTHTGERPFLCDICKKSFGNHSHLVRHIRIHTGEKPFQCNYCEKAFITSSERMKHERVHTGVKPYTCQYCNKTFGDSSNAKTHVARVHKNEIKKLSEVPHQ